VFVALQLVCGTGHRAQYLHLIKSLHELLDQREVLTGDSSLEIPDAHTLKLEALRTIANSLPKYAEPLRNKKMMIFKAAPQNEFIIGDNPVTMDNQKDRGFLGNIGLSVPGIEIYLPISKHLTLGFWCPELITEVQTMAKDIRQMRKNLLAKIVLRSDSIAIEAKRTLREIEPKLAIAEKLHDEIQKGGPVTTYPENMDRFNSMQVFYAERYLASASGHFDLAKQILIANPDVRTRGARGTVS
jgi:hypothetical protein